MDMTRRSPVPTAAKYVALAIALHGAGPAAPCAAQLAERFTPFSERAHRLVNSIAFSPDGQAMYFALLHREVLAFRGEGSDSAPQLAIYSSARVGDDWSMPSLLAVSGRHPDYEPALTADGSLFVFNSRRPYHDGRVPDRNDLWMSLLTDSGWSEPGPIEAVNSFDNEESYPSLMADRTLVYLHGQSGQGGRTSYDLYWSRFVDGQYAPPSRHPVSTDRWGEGDPWIAPDGSYLIFTRWDDEIGWTATVDLYIAFNVAGTWTDPSALEELNTDGPDFGVAVSPDGEWIYYRADSQFHRLPFRPLLEKYRGQARQ